MTFPRGMFGVLALMAATMAESVVVHFKAGDEKLAVFFAGGNDGESLVGVVEPHKSLYQTTEPDHTFILRTVDMKFRAKVSVNKNFGEAAGAQPWILTFRNQMLEEPHAPIELKHSTSGFQWIDPTEVVSHTTDLRHVFEMRDKNKKMMAAVNLDNGRDDL
eukprot:TRINITY_DN96058_c0_g1_i1.p1 TRINITY_DN96058_c0_g1~~TRINITY_DN96058_c0_g1_i1.p1  ORF type:complete len:161 (+),score=36.81 TRINITY_DN96058_c0_g1_i1:76-558(+)